MGLLALNQNPMLISETAMFDLMADEFLAHYDKKIDFTKFLTCDAGVIKYRRDAIRDLNTNPALIAALRSLCACFERLQDFRGFSEYSTDTYREFGLIEELYGIIRRAHDALQEAIENNTARSQALIHLRDLLAAKLADDFTSGFSKSYRNLASGLNNVSALRLRFDLDDELLVRQVCIVAAESKRFAKPTLFKNKKDDETAQRCGDMEPVKGMVTPAGDLCESMIAHQERVFRRQLSKILADTEDLNADLAFYLACLKYQDEMKELGVTLSFPAILEKGRAFSVKGLINPMLLLKNPNRRPVANDLDLNDQNGASEIFLLTGINQGGKTTFVRSIGLMQVLTQLGWPVTASVAAVSLCDRIVTVFSHEEDTGLSQGKLGQELETMRDGLAQMTEKSLILCNEPITGTSPMENLYLSRMILTALKANNVKGIWVTHLYELAAEADQLNDLVPGSVISNLVAQSTPSADATYRIVRGLPEMTSHAKDVLQKEAKR